MGVGYEVEMLLSLCFEKNTLNHRLCLKNVNLLLCRHIDIFGDLDDSRFHADVSSGALDHGFSPCGRHAPLVVGDQLDFGGSVRAYARWLLPLQGLVGLGRFYLGAGPTPRSRSVRVMTACKSHVFEQGPVTWQAAADDADGC